MESIAVFSRISECDLPFYSQWLEYYTQIGIDEFYITGSEKYKNLSFLKEYNVKFFPCIYHEDEKEKMVFFTNLIKKNIKQDYVLMIDVDEYVATNNIKEIISSKELNYFFSWFMIPSLITEYKNMYQQSLDVNGFGLNQGKSLHRVSEINKVFNYHSFNAHIYNLKQTDISLYHFRFRGLRDIINKCYTSNGYTEWHKNDHEKLKKFLSEDKINIKDIPNRIILAAAEYYCVNKKTKNTLPFEGKKHTDFSYYETPIDVTTFEKRFKLFLDNINFIFKQFEFKETACKASLMEFIKTHHAFKA